MIFLSRFLLADGLVFVTARILLSVSQKLSALGARAAQCNMDLAVPDLWDGAEWQNGEMIPLSENVSVRKKLGNGA